MYFEGHAIESLMGDYLKIDKDYETLYIKYLSLEFKNSESQEHAKQGFLRRIKLLKRCIDNVYNICPPDKDDRPTADELSDIAINLQGFIFNIFGSLDNLAWIWAKENNFQYSCEQDVSFLRKKLRKHLSSDFQRVLNDLSKWFLHLKNFRHAVAHRIPLYVPPCVIPAGQVEEYKSIEVEINDALMHGNFLKFEQLSSRQDKLGQFIPWMTHSFIEKAPIVVFHPQMICDWKAVVQIADHFIDELSAS